MVDIRKLKGKIVEQGHTMTSLAAALGVNRATLYRKLRSPESLTVGEVRKLSEVLCLTAGEMTAIFYTSDVARNAT